MEILWWLAPTVVVTAVAMLWAVWAGRDRAPVRDEQRFATTFELVPQTYVLPLADFAAAAPDFAPTGLRTIRLVFDRAVRGTVVLTDVGLSGTMDPAFLAAPVTLGSR